MTESHQALRPRLGRLGLHAFVGLLSVGPVSAFAGEPQMPDWLEGAWQASVGKAGFMEETWSAPAGGTMLGFAREVRGEVTDGFEFRRLRIVDEALSYETWVDGEPPVAFALAESSAESLVFTNPDHGFPTRVEYRLDARGLLHVAVSGPDGGGFGLRFSRRTGARVQPAPDLSTLWDWGDPESSEEAFRSLLPGLDAAEQVSLALEVRTQVARALGLQGRFAEAHALLDEVEAALDGGGLRLRLRYLLERGRTLRSSGHPVEARPLFEEAWSTGAGTGSDGLVVDAGHMVALTLSGTPALEWTLRALDLASTSPDPSAKRWRAALHNNIGWSHHEAGRFEEALGAFQEAVPLRKAQGKEGPRRTAEWAVARALRSLERTEEALDLQHRLLAEHEADGTEAPYVLEEVAECLHALGRSEEARPWFSKAYVALDADPWFREHEAARLARLRELGGE